MAKTVSAAFSEFMDNIVNLETKQTKTARDSRDNLIDHICGFTGEDDFFNVYKDRNLKYGSFERHTKIRPLDDIDLMICFSASNNGDRRTYCEYDGSIHITAIPFDHEHLLVTEDALDLNSTKVINRMIKKLSQLKDYSKAEMHKNQEAATLKLKSYTWNFDIVPCFFTESGLYLIPDGCGNWKETDPRIDNERTTRINQSHEGNILNIIRLIKYWNSQKHTIKIPSYMLECMVLSVYENKPKKNNYKLSTDICELFKEIAIRIMSSVPDPKGIQGNLNPFDYEDRSTISEALFKANQKANEAVTLELSNIKGAINKWREIFGDKFPQYSD